MFAGARSVRFCTDASESSVMHTVRTSLESLGRVSLDRSGDLEIEPKEEFHSFLARTVLKGRIRREYNEYDIRISYRCEPTAACWLIVVAGTPLLFLGWAAFLGPSSAKKTVARAVRQALEEAEDALPEAPDRRYGRASERHSRPGR
jgi:hypothetical protein